MGQHQALRSVAVPGVERLDDLARAEVERLQPVRVEIDLHHALVAAEDLHVLDVRQTQQRFLDRVLGQPSDLGEVQVRAFLGRHRQGQHRRRRGGHLVHLERPDVGRQLGADRVERVGHVGGRRVQALAVLELRRHHRDLVVGGGGHAANQLDGLELLLDHAAHVARHVAG